MSIEIYNPNNSKSQSAEKNQSPYEGIFQETLSEANEKFIARPIFKIEGFKSGIIFIDPNEEVETSHMTDREIALVDVRPSSILKKAIEIQPDDTKLKEILTHIESQDYGDDELLVLDQISASVAIDDYGQFAPEAQTEGFALILSALSGNEIARYKVDFRLSAYYKLIKDKIDKEKEAIVKENENNERYREIEALKLSDIAFVHSTKYDIDRDEKGVIILRSHAHHSENSENPYPRATLHFTTNAEVESHLFGKWSKSNKLIVTAGQSIVDANGLPARMNTIDTYWSINPGQPLRLEGASVVEPKSDLDQLFIDDKENKTVFYLDKQQYTDLERLEIIRLQSIQLYERIYQNPADRQYNLEQLDSILNLENDYIAVRAEQLKGNESAALRRMALDAAMKQQGINTGPLRLEQWSTTDQSFDNALIKLSLELGIPYGIHSGSSEDMVEDRYGRDKYHPKNRFTRGRLEAQRTLVALGLVETKIVNTAPNDLAL